MIGDTGDPFRCTCRFGLPSVGDHDWVSILLLPSAPLDRHVEPDVSCPVSVAFALTLDRFPVAFGRLDADPAAPTLRELAWRAVRGIAASDQAGPAAPHACLPVSAPEPWAELLASIRPRLESSLGCAPLLDYRPLAEADHAWLHSRAEQAGLEQGRAAGAAMSLEAATPDIRALLEAGARIDRSGFYPVPDTRGLTEAYRYCRLVVTTPLERITAAANTGKPLPWEVYDTVFDDAFRRGCNAVLADRLALRSNPYLSASGEGSR